jgi:GDP-4-dehydro-6-deoxy-D-mannose reductase
MRTANSEERTANILVTGAAGFVGRHLLDCLVHDGRPVVAWHRPGRDVPLSADAVRWMPVDMLDSAQVHAGIEHVRPAEIFHLAGWAHLGKSWAHPRQAFEGNVRGTHILFEALRTAGLAPRVLVTSSTAVYRPADRALTEDDPLAPASPYATSKLAQEMVAIRAWTEDRIPPLIARAFNHTGPGQDPSYLVPTIARQIALIEAGRLEPVLRMGNIDVARDLTDVRDTVRAYVAMMRSGRPAVPYNVCSGRALVVRDLVQALIERARATITIQQDPALFRPNDTPFIVGSHARLTADTGWTPQIPIQQTLDDLLGYWRSRIAEA